MKTAAFCIISNPREYHIRAGWLHVVIWRGTGQVRVWWGKG